MCSAGHSGSWPLRALSSIVVPTCVIPEIGVKRYRLGYHNLVTNKCQPHFCVLVYLMNNEQRVHLSIVQFALVQLDTKKTRFRPWVKRSTIGSRVLPVAGPKTWNSLPGYVTASQSEYTFHHQLKVLLFKKSFRTSSSDTYCILPLYHTMLAQIAVMRLRVICPSVCYTRLCV